MKIVRRIVLFLIFLPITAVLAQTPPVTFVSEETQVSLLELYSSEGCYSCPPADKWISKLKTDKRLWKDYVPVAFHVDYWDYIGWKDTFASARFSQRQRNYAALAGSRSVYTPEFFINGKEWRGFFNTKRLPAPGNHKAGQLSLKVEGNTAQINFIPASSADTSYDINIALLGFDIANEIEDGENEGKILVHNFVVLGHLSKTLIKKEAGLFQRSTPLPKPNPKHSPSGIAAWVTVKGNPLPVQAVGGWLQNDYVKKK